MKDAGGHGTAFRFLSPADNSSPWTPKDQAPFDYRYPVTGRP